MKEGKSQKNFKISIRAKILTGMIACVLIVTNLIGWFFIVQAKDTLLEQCKKNARNSAKIAAERIDGDILEQIKAGDEETENYKEILDEKPDIIITCAYGQIIPKELLDYPKYGCINIHASLLPKLRGGAPIHKAIINGYEKTGVTIMYMDEKMDSGDIIYQEEIKIEDDDNAGTLFDKLSVLGSEMIIKVLPSIIDGTNKRIKQNEEEVTYAYNITREEEKVDFNLSTKDVYNKIRGLYPWPIGYTSLDGKKVKLHLSRVGTSKKEGSIGEIINIYNDALGVKTLDGEILLTMIQFEGKNKKKVWERIGKIQERG